MNLQQIPHLSSSNLILDRAFRIAIGDICSNLVPFQDGQLTEPRLCLSAGISYPTLWTRDNSVNTMNFAGLFLPQVAEDSLRAVLTHDPERGGWRIGGQYWDAVIWVQGAWSFYLYRGDRALLKESLEIAERSLAFFEETEFSTEQGLFRGPAFFQDGISGYPDELSNNFGADVRFWLNVPQKWRHPVGVGIPWFALSTNCLYVRAYDLVQEMRKELGLPASAEAAAKAAQLREAIHRGFWNERRRSFDYLLLPDGRRCEHQEGAGLAFAILYGIATPSQMDDILSTVQRAPAGMPCVWPTFPRFANFGSGHYGRHSGTVWPHVQAFWARAALKAGHPDHFTHELFQLARHSVRDGHFTEIYHPVNGEEYGGIQEHYTESWLHLWDCVPHTTWGATSFVALIHLGLLGMDYSTAGIRFAPFLPEGIQHLELTGIPYRNAMLRVQISGTGRKITGFTVNGRATEPFLSADSSGDISISMTVSADE